MNGMEEHAHEPDPGRALIGLRLGRGVRLERDRPLLQSRQILG